MQALKIYVAGPMTPRGKDVHDGPHVFYQNVRKGMLAACEIIRKGHNPYVPHLTYFIHLEMNAPFPKNYPFIWYSLDHAWLDFCDAFLYLEPSFGTDKELERARAKGLKIFYSLDEIPQIVELQDNTEKVE